MTESRTLTDGQRWLLQRLDHGAHPLDGIEPEPARATIERLDGLEPEPWAAAWGALSERFEQQALAAGDDRQAARKAWMDAYRASFIGRYPIPNHPAKQEQYERAKRLFMTATGLDNPAVEVVELPFADGDRLQYAERLRFYVARPAESSRRVEGRLPVVMAWAGIDTWKEEMHERLGALLRKLGFAVLLIDMPGVGESPVYAGRNAERQWTPIFDWLAASDDLDPSRVGAVGGSFGGYWAMKLAYTHRERLRCAVNWGGGVHITFTREWQERSRNASSYLMDLMAARARIFGGSTFEDYVAGCPGLSLLDQGLLDQPSAPLLLCNGRDDVQNSIDDIYLSLDHGDPKAARVFPGGHMGEGPVVPTIVEWVSRQLSSG
ncbi:MAG TPA: alpha/beta fold hydrolase [Solirubrobacteraceae bacterium]|nr:alpha/beta fold hydrolase [Solirubrobacteraceae bacterium]